MESARDFTTEYKVTIGDINYGGHMGNDKYLLMLQEARIRFLASLDCTEGDLGDGVGMIMTEAHVVYSGEIFLHDRVSISVRISEMRGIRFSFEYSAVNAENGKSVATGYTKMAAFDYHKHRPAKIPATFMEKIGKTGVF